MLSGVALGFIVIAVFFALLIWGTGVIVGVVDLFYKTGCMDYFIKKEIEEHDEGYEKGYEKGYKEGLISYGLPPGPFPLKPKTIPRGCNKHFREGYLKGYPNGYYAGRGEAEYMSKEGMKI